MRITVLLIFFISHLIFIPSVFGEGFTLSCPRDYTGEFPIKFKFSEDKKSSWILLRDKWVKLKMKQTEMYYFLGGLVAHGATCFLKEQYRKDGVEKLNFTLPFQYIIDRNTLRLFKKTLEEINISDKCQDSHYDYSDLKGKVLEGFSKPCTVSKIQF